MNRDLTDVLHHGTDRLPVSADGPAAVRRRAEAARRRRRGGAAAVAAVAALSVAAGSVLLGGGSSTAPPPADIPTPEPSVLDQAADIGLDRFLQPTDLPSSPPFAVWTGSRESRDMVGQPSCTTMGKGTPQSSRLVELRYLSV